MRNWGYKPEPVLPEHWKHEQVGRRLQAKATSSLSGTSVDLRPYSSPRHNQGQVGSCVANAVIKALEIKRIVQYGHTEHVDLSVLALYYLARELEADEDAVKRDDGTFISHACDALRRWGICEEELWPYLPAKVSVAPSWMAMRRAYVNKIDSFYRITAQGDARIEQVLVHLHAKNPVVFGTAVHEGWYAQGRDGTPATAIGPLDGKRLGGHATVLVGWDADKSLFLGENSWGSWADNGFYWATPEMVKDVWAEDFWAIAAPWDDWVD